MTAIHGRLYPFTRSALCLTVAAALWLTEAPLRAQAVTLKSPAVVKQLVQAMGARQLTTIAAMDPTEPDRYVAAMLFPDVQLLLISAKTQNPAFLDAQLASGKFEEVYAALHQGVAESKLFVQDMGADGFQGTLGGVADVVYERGTKQTLLDGERKSTGLSEAAYAKHVADLDARYARLATLLLEAVKAKGATGTARQGA